ncbi:NUDIX hydrolase [Clostridium sediminicola]|uniref:NUDIX hydrolase n=1 Tax=Clostridium sediminicola TaxID=3114879 RepID=UPI0031F26E54
MKDKIIYDGWLKLYERKINGRRYEIIKNYDAVAAIIMNERQEILLVKQFRPAYMDYTLEIPAGCLDVDGEDNETCLIRELKEETGLIVPKEKIYKIISYRPIMGFSNSVLHLYKAQINTEEIEKLELNDNDVIEVHWMPLDEFERKIEAEEIMDSKTVMSYLYLKKETFL